MFAYNFWQFYFAILKDCKQCTKGVRISPTVYHDWSKPKFQVVNPLVLHDFLGWALLLQKLNTPRLNKPRSLCV